MATERRGLVGRASNLAASLAAAPAEAEVVSTLEAIVKVGENLEPCPRSRQDPAPRPGQRTPAFTMGTSWRRASWYLQLPRTSGVPWSGVVRLECSADLPLAEVTRLGDLTARLLPPLASAPHKDPRAPQNLVPIGGLERQLQHRLGDQHVLYRALRAAAMPVR
jgi:hypothetical protein